MNRASIIASVSILGAALTANAQPKEQPRKSKTTAVALAAGGIVAPLALAATGIGTDQSVMTAIGSSLLLFTPSLGHFYAKGDLDVTTGMKLRGVSMVAVMTGLLVYSQGICSPIQGYTSCDATYTSPLTYAGIGIISVGAATFLTGAIWDIATAGGAVDHTNQHNNIAFSIAPMLAPPSSGGANGLVLAGSF